MHAETIMDHTAGLGSASSTSADQYEAALRDWVDSGGADSSTSVEKLAASDGLSIAEAVAAHHAALGRILASDTPASLTRVLQAANACLAQYLTVRDAASRAAVDREAYLGSDERYRELFENANDIVFTTDLDGRVTSINRAGELLTGYSREESHRVTLDMLLAPEHLQLAMSMLELKLGVPETRTRYEVEIIARDGRRIPVEVSTRLIKRDGRHVAIQGIARDISDRKQAEQGLRHLNQRLEEKIKGIAHALHDEAGQLLASVYLNVAEIASELPHRGRQRLEELRALLDQVDDQLRRLAHELRPSVLDDLGLVPACEFLAEGVSRRGRLSVIVRGDTGGRLQPDVETALYRVMQEALNNATRHGRARTVAVEFGRNGRVLKGFIRDDGAGFDVAAVLRRTNTQGLGLVGMRERLVAVGGKLSITSRPGSGTSIEFEVPVEN